MSAHTPGPWRRDIGAGLRGDVRAENGRMVAVCWGINTGDPYRPAYKAECDANAHLIAAAPELLRELKKVHSWLGKLTDWHGAEDPDLDGIRAAIAKAEGGDA